MARVIEKSNLDRFEAQLQRRPSYRRLHAKTEGIAKIAAKLIRYRAEKNLSQAALAKAAGISRKALNEIEVLENTNPGFKTLEAISAAMHISVSKLTA